MDLKFKDLKIFATIDKINFSSLVQWKQKSFKDSSDILGM